MFNRSGTKSARQPNYLKAAVLAALALGGGYLSFTQAFSTMSKTNPIVALKMSSANPDAHAALADVDIVLKSKKGSSDFAVAGREARAALRLQPLMPSAVRSLAYIQDTKGHADAVTLFGLADELTRRDLAVHLWHVKQAAAKNDIGQVLHHYDMALRTNKNSGTLLAAPLTQSLADQRIRAAFVEIFKANPPWLVDFVRYQLGGSKNIGEIMDVAVRAKGLPDIEGKADLERALIAKAVEQKQYPAVQRFSATLPATAAQSLKSTALVLGKPEAQFPPVTWEDGRSGEASTYFEADDNGKPIIRIAAHGETTFLAARKLLTLAPGTYDMRVRAKPVTPVEGAWVKARLMCIEGVNERVVAETIVGAATTQRVALACPMQMLEIFARGGASSSDYETVLTVPELVPAS